MTSTFEQYQFGNWLKVTGMLEKVINLQKNFFVIFVNVIINHLSLRLQLFQTDLLPVINPVLLKSPVSIMVKQ